MKKTFIGCLTLTAILLFACSKEQGGSTGYNTGTNAWVAEGWANLECCVTSTRRNHMWTGLWK